MMDSMSTASGSILCHQDANGIDRPSKEHEEKNGSTVRSMVESRSTALKEAECSLMNLMGF